ncbi:MAG: isoprenylcysteine carboxylmethyltransferase family protein [Anaerolineales bacterium]
MNTQSKTLQTIKEIVFYLLGVLLIGGFVILYFPRFWGIEKVPPAIRYLLSTRIPTFLDMSILPTPVRYFLMSNWATVWTIAVNAGIFLLFLVFLSYRTKVEWRSKGVFAAFILALFAEMFGIPLLLFILSPFMHISYYDKHNGGWLNNPLIFGWNGAVVGVWLTLIGMILVIIGWHQIHRAKGLVTWGIYKYIRHPQYTGFFLVMTGWLLHWETTLTLIMYPILAVMYYFLARKEDQGLTQEFGDEYEVYRQKTPMFLPIRWNTFKTQST